MFNNHSKSLVDTKKMPKKLKNSRIFKKFDENSELTIGNDNTIII